MLALAPRDAIARLESLVASSKLPAKEANRCARLADALRRPARVCILGPATGDIGEIVNLLIGSWTMPPEALPPALQLTHSDVLRSTATLEDGTNLTQAGWPTEDMLRRSPVFIQITLPSERLRLMSILVLALDVDPGMHRPALSWAARRSEIAVWCTPSFGEADALIWSLAPERLSQHAYLLETRSEITRKSHSDGRTFTGSFALDTKQCESINTDLDPLLDRLTADIEEARVADLDMAQLFLHRLRHHAPASCEANDDQPELFHTNERTTTPSSQHALLDLRLALSEPLLYLISRSRALWEQLSHPVPLEDWASSALTHCADTIEGLRDRAENWPDHVPAATSLQAMIDEVGDLTMLLQIEGGTEQALTAVSLLFQLRIGMEQALGWETA